MGTELDNSGISINADSYPSEAPFIPSLNGIRAISVLLVVVAHAGFERVVPGGLGVTVFFFLSGYLITSLFLIEQTTYGRISIDKFYLRRVFRLFPPLIVTIAISYMLVAAGILSGRITIPGLLSQLLYFSNYYIIYFDPPGNTIPDGTNILWSLAVEEHFYIFYPIGLSLMLKYIRDNKYIIAVLIVLCTFVALWRVYLVLHGADENRTYYATDTRIDSILFGCILALGWNRNITNNVPARDRSARPNLMSLRQWLLFAGAVCVLLATLLIREDAFRQTWRYSIQGIALTPIFYFAIKYNSNHLFKYLNTKTMNTLGTFSYFIYLIHLIVMTVIASTQIPLLTRPTGLIASSLLISVFYAMFLNSFVDPYFRRLRHRLRQGNPRLA
jgi:peptidoglycan/LPS O-acetylase OafA/YrhL